MKIAVIGAGASGLNSIKHIVANNFECVAFEQTGEIGGTWVYTDNVGIDKYGIPVHTSMYQGLRTNLPKEIMGFSDFRMPDRDISYLSQKDVLEFLHSFAKEFDLLKHIKFYNQVKSVKPIENERWEIIAMDIRTKEETKYEFDAVMVCNGHHFQPHYAKLKGIEKFQGSQKHSHDYRKPEEYRGRQVVIIGAGPSGVDLAFHVSKEAAKVFLSHHSKNLDSSQFPEHVVQKPDIEEVTENTVIFKDGSEEEADAILYCTGYQYSFPFLSKECGIFVDDNYVQPLYKHLINIEHPTMALVGLPFIASVFFMFDLQARFFIELIKNPAKFPSKEEMLQDKCNEERRRQEKGWQKKLFHMLGEFQEIYFQDLVQIGQLKPIPSVIVKIYDYARQRVTSALKYYRGDIYSIIDDETFSVQHATKETF